MSKKCLVCGVHEPQGYMVICTQCLKSADAAMKHDNGLSTIAKWAINRYKWGLKQKKKL